jgi:hypothetical protein
MGFTPNLEEEAHGFNKWQLGLMLVKSGLLAEILVGVGAGQALWGDFLMPI